MNTNKYEVTKEYRTEFTNPIKLNKGDSVKRIEESNPDGDWPNWVFCKSSTNEGWVPKQILNGSRVIEDYDAAEFNLDIGEVVVEIKELNGWIWGYKEGNANIESWAPLNYMKKV